MARTTRWIVVASLAVVVGSCASKNDQGDCRVTEYVVGTSYSEEVHYCSNAGACDTFCAAAAGNPAYGACHYDGSTGYLCGDPLPAPPRPYVACALYRSIACAGAADDFQPYCDAFSCDSAPGTQSYDASTDCTTRYRGPTATGSSCDAALASLP